MDGSRRPRGGFTAPRWFRVRGCGRRCGGAACCSYRVDLRWCRAFHPGCGGRTGADGAHALVEGSRCDGRAPLGVRLDQGVNRNRCVPSSSHRRSAVGLRCPCLRTLHRGSSPVVGPRSEARLRAGYRDDPRRVASIRNGEHHRAVDRRGVRDHADHASERGSHAWRRRDHRHVPSGAGALPSLGVVGRCRRDGEGRSRGEVASRRERGDQTASGSASVGRLCRGPRPSSRHAGEYAGSDGSGGETRRCGACHRVERHAPGRVGPHPCPRRSPVDAASGAGPSCSRRRCSGTCGFPGGFRR